ncbi:MAG: transporter [Acidobacteriota bacterium]
MLATTILLRSLVAVISGAVQAPVDGVPITQAGESQADQEEAAALGPMVTDRPDATESTETVSPGIFQLEMGYTNSRIEEERAHVFGEILLRVGLSELVELRLGFNSYRWVSLPQARLVGVEDSSLGVKLRLLEGGAGFGLDRPAVALLVTTALPTGSSAFRENSLQPEVRLALSWELTERVGMGSNLAFGYLSESGARFDQFSATLTAGYAVSDRVGVYLEYFGTFPEAADGRHRHFLNSGATFLLDRDLQLDARIGTGLNGRAKDHFLGVGTSLRW